MKKTRAVMVGCGSIADVWLGSDTVREKVEIVGLVDLNPASAESKKTRYVLETAQTGTDLADLLEQVRPAVVFDCTVPEAHYMVTLTALKHGCHVLGEKPMSDSMPRARKMTAAALKTGKTYAVMQNRRYQAEIRSLRRFIDRGIIGKLIAVHSDFFIGAHFGGFRDAMDHVLLLDMAIHSFDQARFISGEDALGVYCHEWTPRHSWYRHGPCANAIFEMTGNMVYTYRGSWCAEGCPTTWECNWRLIGEKGTLLWDGGRNFRCETVAAGNGFIRPVKTVKLPAACPAKLARGHDSAIGDFLNAVRGNRTPETVCSDNIKSLAMVHAAVKSATTGRQVKIKN